MTDVTGKDEQMQASIGKQLYSIPKIELESLEIIYCIYNNEKGRKINSTRNKCNGKQNSKRNQGNKYLRERAIITIIKIKVRQAKRTGGKQERSKSIKIIKLIIVKNHAYLLLTAFADPS